MSDIVQKPWGFCHTLRHDGIDYGDYIEQITYLLFLKMADERAIDLSTLPYDEQDESGQRRQRKKDCSWPALRQRSGIDLTDHYAEALRIVGKQPGILGDIYAGAQSRFTNPVNLKKVVSLVDETEWTSLGVDVEAEAYEGLLERAASKGEKGAGQYFTPRVLIQSIIRCMKPDPRVRNDFTIADPACGTGGFLVAAWEWLMEETGGGKIDRDVAKRIRSKAYHGQELVRRPRRLALMNFYLHGLEPAIRLGDTIYETPSGQKFDVILTNPLFGTKGANQLNFLQQILTVLKPGGRAAVVLPDNCLFADQAGEVFEIVAHDCDVHTILRLPRGTFTPY